MEWFQNFGFTFVVEAETQEEAEALLEAMAFEALGSHAKDAWAGEVEALV